VRGTRPRHVNGYKPRQTIVLSLSSTRYLKVVPDEAGRHQSDGIEPRYLKLADVATYLSTSVSRGYALVRSGELPPIKLGGRGVWRVDRKKLEEYVERLEEETQAWARSHPLTTTDSQAR
jgi:excisionase family DNA binding protein